MLAKITTHKNHHNTSLNAPRAVREKDTDTTMTTTQNVQANNAAEQQSSRFPMLEAAGLRFDDQTPPDAAKASQRNWIAQLGDVAALCGRSFEKADIPSGSTPPDASRGKDDKPSLLGLAPTADEDEPAFSGFMRGLPAMSRAEDTPLP